ncbi:SHOCT domain-containing protein [Nocardia sp. NPDC046763]|uniref:SHOCT domain-containing protein n=1 Tax=Nocardia sp. NPDC046763 TaxID=3155256 RepID=UPI0033FE7185
MSDTAGSGRRPVGVALLILSILLGTVTWLLLRRSMYVAHDIPWTCDSEGCGTNDFRVLYLIGGIAADVALVGSSWLILRMAGFGSALALCGFAFVSGWHAAIAEGAIPLERDATAITIWTVIGWVGVGVAALGLLYDLAMTGTVVRLLGHPSVPARLTRFETVDNHGTALMTFTDSDGFDHTRRVRAGMSWLYLPVRAVYRRSDPTRNQLAVPWYRPVRTTTTISEGSQAERLDQLERLAAIYREGLLTDLEFQRAKDTLLDP